MFILLDNSLIMSTIMQVSTTPHFAKSTSTRSQMSVCYPMSVYEVNRSNSIRIVGCQKRRVRCPVNERIEICFEFSERMNFKYSKISTI